MERSRSRKRGLCSASCLVVKKMMLRKRGGRKRPRDWKCSVNPGVNQTILKKELGAPERAEPMSNAVEKMMNKDFRERSMLRQVHARLSQKVT